METQQTTEQKTDKPKNGEVKPADLPLQTALATATAAPATAPKPTDDPTLEGSMSPFASSGNFAAVQRMARMLSSSSIVPKAYQGENAIPNCVIAIEMASRIGAGVMSVMQHLHVINGKPGWDSTFLIGSVNTSRKFTPLRFKFVGERNTDAWGCYAIAKDKETAEECEGTTITIAMARAEGWYDRTGSKWKTMPQQMLMYRAASFWTRVYAPELSLGMHAADEIEDMGNQPLDVGPVGGSLADVPHADTANSGRRMSLGKPATAPTIVDAQTVPAQAETAPTAAPVDAKPAAATVAEFVPATDARKVGDAPTAAEVAAPKPATRGRLGIVDEQGNSLVDEDGNPLLTR